MEKTYKSGSAFYKSWWNEVSTHLGGIYPFYNMEKPNDFSLNICESLNSRRELQLPIKLDLTALAAKICLPYLLGNRTLIKGVQRAPWMSTYMGNGQWEDAPLPLHGQTCPDPDFFTEKLKQALLEEVRSYTKDMKTVGVLLSGGMDSRVVAGLLKEQQIRKEGPDNIVALTWGDENCRDVVYSKRIVKKFGWDMVHFPITPETLQNNITHAARAGAEVSPLHFHAMPEVAKLKDIDVIVAGSYGDSVGRAEFSGTRVTRLKPVLPTILDRFGLIKDNVLNVAKCELKKDVINSSHFDEPMTKLRRHEIEQEMHYMRRMLQSCMQIVAAQIPLYQLFTAPTVFGLMWGLEASIRDNKWYVRLLSRLPGDLLNIPWARTGYGYDQPSGTADKYSKSFHSYSKWLRNELKESILTRINSEHIWGLGIFNYRGLENLIKIWQGPFSLNNSRLDEVVSWLASLHDFIDIYAIPAPSINLESNLKDFLRVSIGSLLMRNPISLPKKLVKHRRIFI